MAKSTLEQPWEALCCSSSILNFRDKLEKKLGIPRYSYWKHHNKNVLFVGMYHWGDYLKFLFHIGYKTVFWCGSDIKNLASHSSRVKRMLRQTQQHICENNVEQTALSSIGIKARIQPWFFDDTSKYPVCYKHSNKPRVYATYHKGREDEYGYFEHPQIDWFCDLPEEEFNERIKDYQGCIRLNKFDGFAESLAKSVLMGQYQWSEIPYPYMSHTATLQQWLDDLKNKKKPNYEAREYWSKILV